jgi:hypothetical protein
VLNDVLSFLQDLVSNAYIGIEVDLAILGYLEIRISRGFVNTMQAFLVASAL